MFPRRKEGIERTVRIGASILAICGIHVYAALAARLKNQNARVKSAMQLIRFKPQGSTDLGTIVVEKNHEIKSIGGFL